ncbi:hypothetical protein [Burkholderia territorii]|uniref:hypothetical protein n=1 Tax=Burkholderia territorii TaxID=1503055 RepID=UPI000A939A00|nr:hypothetical protein [Burkholderia territorii]
MIRKPILMFLAVLSACVHAEVSVSGESSVLEYANGEGNVYRSLYFKRPDGMMFTPFDEGLRFYKPGVNSLSPDGKYSIVSFSAQGDLDGSSGVSVHTEYLCAFVRMKDGCVVHVAQDAVCGGEWHPPHQWSINIEPILDNPPSAADTYAVYVSKRRSGYQISRPPILAYLAEGTAFDNLLACDPPNSGNRGIYSKLLIQLQVDGNTENSAKLTKILSGDQNRTSIHAAQVESGAWTAHAVTSKKAYLYEKPEKSSITRAYLVQDDLLLVNRSSLSHGFMSSRYRQKNGSILERWIRCEDVNACFTGN